MQIELEYFNIREIELYDSAGDPIPRGQLTAALSTEYSSDTFTWPASNCIDGDLQTVCGTFNRWTGNDFNPWAAIKYPCANGSTSLSKVVVYNSDDTPERLLSYLLMFLDASGAPDRGSYRFTKQQLEYTVEGMAELLLLDA